MLLRPVGKTEDGKIVVAGVFRLEDTEGIPLALSLGIMKDNNMIPDWLDFYAQARANGWKHKTVIAKVGEAVVDVYGPEFRDVVIERLNQYA